LACLFLLIVMGIYYQRTGPPSSPSGGVPVVRLPASAVDSLSMSLEEVDALTQANATCPLCFGRDACEELMSDISLGRLQVERKPFRIPDTGRTDQVAHRVYRNGKVRFWLRPQPPDPALLTNLEESLCRKDPRNRHKKGLNCDLASASKSLQMEELSVSSIRSLYKHHLVSGKRIPLTACPSWRLLEGLIRSYDENDDKTLMGEEKAALFTTLAANPEIAVYRFGLANKLQFPFLPFFGACGRSTFVQGPVVSIKTYLDQPLQVRLELAAEVLKMVEGFIHEDPLWLLFTTDLSLDNLVVEESGQVFLRDLSLVMLIDKDTQQKNDDDAATGKDADANADHMHSAASSSKAPFICDNKCFGDFYDDLVGGRPGADEEGQQCKSVSRYAGHMYSLVCQNVLQQQSGIGLLHSLDKDEGDALANIDASLVKTLISKCARSDDLNAREASAVELLDLLTEDDEDDDEDGDDEDDDATEQVLEGEEEEDDADEDDLGDEDLGEDQYAKAHDRMVVKTKDDKYDFEDEDKSRKKDMMFP